MHAMLGIEAAGQEARGIDDSARPAAAGAEGQCLLR